MDWTTIIFVILALALGAVIGWLVGSRGSATATERGVAGPLRSSACAPA